MPPRCGNARRAPSRVVDRISWILRKGVQDVGEDQFLVLLLVMQPDLQDRQHLRELRSGNASKQAFDGGVDMGAIARTLRDCRAA